MNDELLAERLRDAGAHVTVPEVHGRGLHLRARAPLDCLEACALVAHEAGLYPVFMTAVHADPAFELCYRFAAAERDCRVTLSAPAGPDGCVPSLSRMFPGLQWHEREAIDMFGIVFGNHPDPRPLLLPEEDRGLHPLRKDAARLKTRAQLGCAAHTDAGGRTP
jgi:NADH:ubiquinone oxidoreductase subunit C